MLNVITLMGRCVATPEIKTMENEDGRYTVGKYRLAVERDYKNRDGSYPVDFFQCSVTGRVAEYAHKNFKRGMWVIVEGRLCMEPYEKDGDQRIFPVIRVKSHYPVFPPKAKDTGNMSHDSSSTENDSVPPTEIDRDPFRNLVE